MEDGELAAKRAGRHPAGGRRLTLRITRWARLVLEVSGSASAAGLSSVSMGALNRAMVVRATCAVS
jgi:hypothetical protein